MEHIHMIGIGGTGLSAIAKVLLEEGYQVSGSDLTASEFTAAVSEAGGKVMIGHHKDQIEGADLVIRSSAIPDDNPEVQAALAAGLPVLKRSEFLNRLTEGKRILAVAGSHGKTTTTSMLAWIFTALDQKPSFIVGGPVENLQTNARAGTGELFIIEADEYDHMFLGLKPDLGVITNIEHDHPDLFPTEEDFFKAFSDFLEKFNPGADLIYCADHPGAVWLADQEREDLHRFSYGIQTADVDYRAENLAINDRGGFSFDIVLASQGESARFHVDLRIPGRHNVLNALGAFAAADRCQLSRKWTARALTDFQGSGRRFDIRGEYQGILLVDDYGHHPTEIQASLEAARSAYPERNIIAVWQPHTYSRTETLLDDFQAAFSDADQVIIMDVYAARETPPEGFDIKQVVESIHHPQTSYLPTSEEIMEYLTDNLQNGDVLLVFTAGDAIQINEQLEESLTVETA